MLVDCISGLPLYELPPPANVADSTVVEEILTAANSTLPTQECTFLGDKGYDVNAVYDLGKDIYDALAHISALAVALAAVLPRCHSYCSTKLLRRSA